MERFLSEEDRFALATQFEQLRQGSMSVHEYSLKFTRLARYAKHIIYAKVQKLRRFVHGLGPHVMFSIAATAMLHVFFIGQFC